AELTSTKGHMARGTVTFTPADGGMRVVASLQALEPGTHGLHIHEIGDCSAPDASSAGDHFNPDGSPHGAPKDPPSRRHAGDLGNITAGDDGSARKEMV